MLIEVNDESSAALSLMTKTLEKIAPSVAKEMHKISLKKPTVPFKK